MPLAELLPIAGALAAPAFFLVFGLAALGAPPLALACLASSQLKTTQYIEAYSRRLLRMALSAAVPALLALCAVLAAAFFKVPWLRDWVMAAPLGPGLLAVSIPAYLALLTAARRARRAARRSRQDSPLAQTFVLALLALGLLLLLLALGHGVLEQAQAVLGAPAENGLAVVPLFTPDISALPSLFWAALAATVPLGMACAGAMSLEYLLLLRDQEPFGQEALSQMLRIAARATLRCALLSAAFLPVLWIRLEELPGPPEALHAVRVLLGLAGGCTLLLCLAAGSIARAGRPWARSGTMHLCLLLLWVGLTALLDTGLAIFYAQ